MAIPFFPQERPESCVPACLRMILADFGIQRSESDIYECCQTDLDGTLARTAAECAESFDLQASILRLTSLEQVKQLASQPDSRVIAFINVAPLLGVNVLHAVIVTNLDDQSSQVQILDPAHMPNGQRNWAIEQFQLAWQLAGFLVIVIRAL